MSQPITTETEQPATQTMSVSEPTPPFTKSKAVAIHCVISAIIFAVLSALVFFCWYPDWYFATDGGWEGIQLVLGVDIILGPLLTLIVFKANKPNLKWDLFCIGVIQVGALLAGTYIVHQQRPLGMSFVDNHFVTFTTSSFKLSEEPIEGLETVSGHIPKTVYIDFPDDQQGRKDLRRDQLNGQRLLAVRVDRFQDYTPNALKAVQYGGIDLPSFLKKYPEKELKLNNWMQRKKLTRDEIVLVDFSARYQHRILALRKSDGKILGLTPK